MTINVNYCHDEADIIRERNRRWWADFFVLLLCALAAAALLFAGVVWFGGR